MTENNNTGDMSTIAKYLSKIYAQNIYFGAFLTALLGMIWIVWLIMKRNLEWKIALQAASNSLSQVAKDSEAFESSVEEGDEWEVNT